jgi:hypothetical protein
LFELAKLILPIVQFLSVESLMVRRCHFGEGACEHE